jgi:hypothetical protein
MSETATRAIYIIRHGEKPESPPPFGVDLDGNQNLHSLLPVGWERAGGLAGLFAPFDGRLRDGLLTPDQLISPDYVDPTRNTAHRTYQTISALSQISGVSIENPHAEGEEGTLAAELSAVGTGVTLVCWEHHAIPAIANAIAPIASGTQIPQTWPDSRFDLVWSFTRDASGSDYGFTQVPQMALAGDLNTPIS